jgi:GTPase SAR1 family protein
MPATIEELRTSLALEDTNAGSHRRSSFDLKQYERRRKKVADLAQRLAQIAEELGAPESAGSLRQAVSGMFEEVFSIVVVGEFSRGKSTVINALLGAQVLPKSPSETTAVLSHINFGNTKSYHVCFRDSSLKAEISSKEFAGLVAPPEPAPEDADGVRTYEDRLAYLHSIEYVQVDYPVELCRDGVRIIDTPGTNGLNPAREDITYKIIPSADAVVFVLSAQTPATASELAFLRNQVKKADLGKIFLVMNFADSIDTAKDRERVVSHAKREISSIIPSPEIFLVSAREALYHRLGKKTKLSLSESGYPLLESGLGRFLGSERGSVRLAKPLDLGSRVADELVRVNLMLQRRALEMPIEELKKKVEQIEPRLAAVAIERDAVLASLRLELSNKGQDLARDWRQGLDKIASVAEHTRASYLGLIDKDELIRTVEGAVARLQTDLNEQLQVAQRAATCNAVLKAQNRLKETWDDFYVEFDRAFASDSEWRSTPDWTSATGAWVPDVLVPAMKAGGFWGLLATIASVFVSERSRFDNEMRAAVKERYSKSIPRRVEQWRVGWVEHISSVENALSDECNRKLSDIQNQLDISVMEHKSAEGSAEQKLARLKDLEVEISSIQMGVNAMKKETGLSR